MVLIGCPQAQSPAVRLWRIPEVRRTASAAHRKDLVVVGEADFKGVVRVRFLT